MKYKLNYPMYGKCPFCGGVIKIKLFYVYDGYRHESPDILINCRKCEYNLTTDNEEIVKRVTENAGT